MQWAVDGDNIALAQHFFQAFHTSAANFFLDFWLEWLVIEVEQLFAVEWLESSKHTLTDASYCNGPDSLSLEIIFTFGDCCHIPVAVLDLLACGNEVAYKG